MGSFKTFLFKFREKFPNSYLAKLIHDTCRLKPLVIGVKCQIHLSLLKKWCLQRDPKSRPTDYKQKAMVLGCPKEYV